MSDYLETAIEAARQAGELLRANFETGTLVVDELAAHDVKLALDVETQTLITQVLLGAYRDHALYGEEGMDGNSESPFQWIVDPIDGTVNFFHGIPHFCISIALRQENRMLCGVILDPMRNEMWTTRVGEPSRLNGRVIHTSPRTELSECILSVGFAKTGATINSGLPVLESLVHRARKCRMLGSAALDMAYVATGRLDAYIEQGISLWDIAAGWILIENAGGTVDLKPRADMKDKFSVVASSGLINQALAEAIQ